MAESHEALDRQTSHGPEHTRILAGLSEQVPPSYPEFRAPEPTSRHQASLVR